MSTELDIKEVTKFHPTILSGRLDDLWTPSTTQRWALGAGYRFGDRSWYYGKGGEVVYPDRVAAFYTSFHYASGYSTAAAVVAGDKVVLLTNASQTFTKDQLVGGWLIIGHAAAANTECRRIIGNTASAGTPATETIYVYLDAPLSLAHVITTFCEVIGNPYADIRYGGVTASDLASPAGVPPAGMTVANMYGWFQTWGPRYVCPGGGWTTFHAGVRSVVRVGDGTVNDAGTTAAANFAVVGQVIDRTTSATSPTSLAGPIIDLRIKY
jgi:hypothetical protein